MLHDLFLLPQSISLTIETLTIEEGMNDIYSMMFIVPKLKYYRISLFKHYNHHQITLPIARYNESTSLQYLIIDHECSFSELLLLLSYTPQLIRLTIHKIYFNDSDNKMFTSIKLSNINSIYLNLQRITFSQMEIFIIKTTSNLKRLFVMINSENITFRSA
ncbi:unnamed protein product [Adineta steineri]|uniref:Uncharacterized protein n=2 Tax=Adineta steineri TaxID=433720 RepID=A0A814TUE0_9BILA|nr:unnamed protein product [Adineta steineri]